MSTFYTSPDVYFLHTHRYIVVSENGKNGPLINADFVTMFADLLSIPFSLLSCALQTGQECPVCNRNLTHNHFMKLVLLDLR
jgi:hypothetical protein